LPIIADHGFKALGEATDLWAKLKNFTECYLSIQKSMAKIIRQNVR